jgi:hypothetical protein
VPPEPLAKTSAEVPFTTGLGRPVMVSVSDASWVRSEAFQGRYANEV